MHWVLMIPLLGVEALTLIGNTTVIYLLATTPSLRLYTLSSLS